MGLDRVSYLGLPLIISLFYFSWGGGGGGGGEGGCGSLSKGLSPFRFENMWIKEEGFKDLIKGWWQSFEFKGTSSYVMLEKLKAIKFLLKT